MIDRLLRRRICLRRVVLEVQYKYVSLLSLHLFAPEQHRRGEAKERMKRRSSD
jgi:hypothetical protein